MDSLDQRSIQAREMPRFDDGMVNLQELIRIMAESLINEIMDAQAEDAEADALAYLDFPYAHHRRLRTNNVQERCNRELKRRSNVVQVFPSRKSLVRMLGAVYFEMDEDWASRRWFSEPSMALLEGVVKTSAPTPSYEGAASEHAKRIMGLVMADNPIDRKAA